MARSRSRTVVLGAALGVSICVVLWLILRGPAAPLSPVVGAEAFAVSQGGGRIACVSRDGARFWLTITEPGAEVRVSELALPLSRDYVGGWLALAHLVPAWSADGRLAWPHRRSGPQGQDWWVVRCGLPGEEARELKLAGLGGPDAMPAYCTWGPSPPTRLAFLVGPKEFAPSGWSLLVVEVPSGQELTRVPNVAFEEISWSPTGRRIAFFRVGPRAPRVSSADRELWVLDLTDGQQSRLAGQVQAPAAWSSDGAAIFVSGRVVRKHRAPGLARIPPGRWTVVVGRATFPQAIRRVPLAGSPRVVTKPPSLETGEGDAYPTLAQGGGALAFIRRGEAQDKVLVRVGGEVRCVAQTSRSLHHLQWDPKCKGLWCIAYQRRRGRHWTGLSDPELCWVSVDS